ncbi:class A beta-lactamase, subclass A2 [uncultured Flavobacterium sp.]|uniref:class A beta-lactamase, subclass A2 n=1 Tax=uncultured Flavobacterium sp. TaxID=165435 RepID=UPI0030817A2C
MKKILFLFFIALFSIQMFSQSSAQLRKEIEQIIASKNATVGISMKGIEDKDTMSINGNLHSPMMSIFKFHIALTVLNQVDSGMLKLEQKIFITKEDLLQDTWSPIRDEFPNVNRDFTLDQLLRYTVSHSDNNGCDILLKFIGGPKTVQKNINKQGIQDFVIKVNEQEMSIWENLYLNKTTTPEATTKLLEKFYKREILKKSSTKYLYQLMVETSRGRTWMKAGLPENTELAHRTGISGTNDEDLRAGMNDVGIVKLPNGKHFILSIFLKNITEEFEDTERIIADITKAVWEYNVKK